jgi:threonine/homoserine/homoserine lactone efflux protein
VDGVVAVLLLGFFSVSALVIVTPGQDTALTIRNTLRGGRRGGVLTACGVATGQCGWALATSAGLAALLVASEPVFHALRLFGAVYLGYLGLQSLLRAVRKTRVSGSEPRGQARPYRQGFLSNLGNPKMALFFAGLLPQFQPAARASFLPMLLLGTLFAALTLIWLGLYSVLIARAHRTLLRPRVRRMVDALAGTTLVALGIRLAADS